MRIVFVFENAGIFFSECYGRKLSKIPIYRKDFVQLQQNPLTICTKRSILDVWQGSEYGHGSLT